MKAFVGIYSGCHWYDAPEGVPASSCLKKLSVEEQARVDALLEPLLTQLQSSGWFPGRPDRTLIHPALDVRVVYGGTMADELGMLSLNGTDTRGFCRSREVVELLRQIELTKPTPWWKLW